MEYKIVNASNISTLVESVNREIKNGWIPQGGFVITRREGVYQAMIKK